MKADDDVQMQTNNNEERPSPAVAPQPPTSGQKPQTMMSHITRKATRRSNEKVKEKIGSSDKKSFKRTVSTEIVKIEE